MDKNEYVNYWSEKLWESIDNLYTNQKSEELIQLPSIKINHSDFIDYSISHFDLAQQDWEQQKEYYSEEGNKKALLNTSLGYGKHNSFVLNYGKEGNSNDQLKHLFGISNFETLNLLPETVLMRLIVKFPGHGFPYHVDDASSYHKRFSSNLVKKAKRIWIPISPWADGHMFQISDKVITHWKSGDVYQIPWGVPHLGVNYGLKPQITLNITGCTNE